MADNTDTTQALKQASDAVQGCVDRCRAVSAQHSGTATIHEDLRGLHAQIPDSNLRTQLAAKMAAAMQSHKAVADGHDQLTRGLEAAQLAVRGAADAAGSDSYTEPSHDTESQGGTYGSGPGRITKSFTPEAIRERDQRRGIEMGYLAEIAALRGR